MTHVVTKPLPGPQGVIPVGTEVDASDWPKVRLLEEQRYLKPIEKKEKRGRQSRNKGD